jgi:hypothetical protein
MKKKSGLRTLSLLVSLWLSKGGRILNFVPNAGYFTLYLTSFSIKWSLLFIIFPENMRFTNIVDVRA